MRVAVIGSGPAGVAAATALLDHGCRVAMFDVGHRPPPSTGVLAAELLDNHRHAGRPSFRALQEMRCGFPILQPSWRAGRELSARRARKAFLGSSYAFEGVDEWIPCEGADPPRSLALGGLSTVWGAACYPMAADEFEGWQITAADLGPFYTKAATMLGVDQADDALADAYPLFGPVAAAASRNPGSAVDSLLRRWGKAASALKAAGLRGGRSRLAVRFSGESSCVGCGLCLWGCPTGAIFSSAVTVGRLQRHANFQFHGAHAVSRFRRDADGSIRLQFAGAAPSQGGFDRLVLAAGTVSSFRIAAQSLEIADAVSPILDNDMQLVPFLSAERAQNPSRRHQFALSEAALNIDAGDRAERAHVQLYSAHPYFLGRLGDIIDSGGGMVGNVFRRALSSIVLGFIYRSGAASRRARVRARVAGEVWGVVFEAGARSRSFEDVLGRLAREGALGLRPLGWASRPTPLGFSGHLAGTLPMRIGPGPLETDALGRLGGCAEVVVADASVFPTLAPQNPTLTVVANAVRVASALAGARP